MQNDTGECVDLYCPRKCSASNRIIHAKDHASIQLSIAEVDPQTGRMTESTKNYALCGAIRRMGESDDCIVRLTKKDGILAKFLSHKIRTVTSILCVETNRFIIAPHVLKERFGLQMIAAFFDALSLIHHHSHIDFTLGMSPCELVFVMDREMFATDILLSVMEPMMLEDYNGTKLPLSLENLFNFSKKNGLKLDKNDITAFFIYIMMLESGFVASDCPNLQEITTCNVHSDFHYQRFLFLSKFLPRDWKRDNIYTLNFILPPFVQHLCTVIGIVVSDDIVVNCSIKNIDDAKFCMLIDPSMYVVKSSNVHSVNMFQNLRALSIKFKTMISNSSKCVILHTYSLRSASLQGMPPEIILKNRATLETVTVPEATNIGTMGHIPDHSMFNGDLRIFENILALVME
ncbi:hypothetical protein FQR65_LT17796 [Abscondita terminalis]|nr:hypothetical protein FQR65_LT17796 [Abscondita terminalis]